MTAATRGRGRPRIGTVREYVIPDDLHERVVAHADHLSDDTHRVSAAEVVRRALVFYLGSYDGHAVFTDALNDG